MTRLALTVTLIALAVLVAGCSAAPKTLRADVALRFDPPEAPNFRLKIDGVLLRKADAGAVTYPADAWRNLDVAPVSVETHAIRDFGSNIAFLKGALLLNGASNPPQGRYDGLHVAVDVEAVQEAGVWRAIDREGRACAMFPPLDLTGSVALRFILNATRSFEDGTTFRPYLDEFAIRALDGTMLAEVKHDRLGTCGPDTL